jgi:hypothetical protein
VPAPLIDRTGDDIAANTTIVGLDANGHFAAAVGIGAAVNFFVDVLGYYV